MPAELQLPAGASRPGLPCARASSTQLTPSRGRVCGASQKLHGHKSQPGSGPASLWETSPLSSWGAAFLWPPERVRRQSLVVQPRQISTRPHPSPPPSPPPLLLHQFSLFPPLNKCGLTTAPARSSQRPQRGHLGSSLMRLCPLCVSSQSCSAALAASLFLHTQALLPQGLCTCRALCPETFLPGA